jgi:hypothetical protein
MEGTLDLQKWQQHHQYQQGVPALILQMRHQGHRSIISITARETVTQRIGASLLVHAVTA